MTSSTSHGPKSGVFEGPFWALGSVQTVLARVDVFLNNATLGSGSDLMGEACGQFLSAFSQGAELDC